MRTTTMLLAILWPTLVLAQPLSWHNLFAIRGQVNEPEPRHSCALGYDPIRDFLIIFGGVGRSGLPLADTWVLDLRSNRWYSNIQPGPRGMHAMVSGFHKGQLFVTSGCLDCPFQLWAFNSSTFRWREVVLGGSVVGGGRVGAGGGLFPGSPTLLLSQGDPGPHSDTFMLDLDHRSVFQLEWRQGSYDPSGPHSRGHAASVMISAVEMLVLGGCIKQGPCPASDSWIFNAEKRSWARVPSCSIPRQKGSLGIQLGRDGLYAVLVGGEFKSHQTIRTPVVLTSELHIFNISSRSWFRREIFVGNITLTGLDRDVLKGDRPPMLSGASAVASPRGMFVFGGIDSLGNFTGHQVWLLEGDPSEGDLLSCAESWPFSLLTLHAIIMFVAFGLCLHIGAVIAHFGSGSVKGDGLDWRCAHIILQSSGCVLGLAGAVVGFYASNAVFRSVHGSLGFVLVLLYPLQGVFVAVWKYVGEWRRGWLRAHFWLGCFLHVFSVGNVSLGLFLWLAPTYLWTLWFLFVALLLLVLLVGAGRDVFRDNFPYFPSDTLTPAPVSPESPSPVARF